jgi:hypothetical protein
MEKIFGSLELLISNAEIFYSPRRRPEASALDEKKDYYEMESRSGPDAHHRVLEENASIEVESRRKSLSNPQLTRDVGKT